MVMAVDVDWIAGLGEQDKWCKSFQVWEYLDFIWRIKKSLGDSEEINGVADPYRKAVTLAVVQRIPRAEITNPTWKILGLLFWEMIVNNMH